MVAAVNEVQVTIVVPIHRTKARFADSWVNFNPLIGMENVDNPWFNNDITTEKSRNIFI